MLKNLKHYLFAGFSLCFFGGICLYFAYNIWQAWQLDQALDTRGISTVATITGCNYGQKSTPVTFEYFVITKAGKKIRYEASNSGGGGSAAKCKKGKTLFIRYLPEAPEQAQHAHASDIFMNSVAGIAALIIFIALVVMMIKEGIVPKEKT